MKLDFSKERLDGIPVPIGPGMWLAGETHAPGGNKSLPVNNRCFIFQLKLQEDLAGAKKGEDVLFAFGLGQRESVNGIKQFVKDSGLPMVAMLTNGGTHHMSIKFWYDAFPAMKVWVCPTRVPGTHNAKHLMEDYPDRWELADNTTIPHHVYQLTKYFGDQVDCVIFNQFFVYGEKSVVAAGGWCSVHDKPKHRANLDVFTKLMAIQFQDRSCPHDETVFYHKGAKLIITGHHIEFVYVPVEYDMPEDLKATGWAWKFVQSMIVNRGRYVTGFMAGVDERIRDPAIHAEQWQEVLKYDFEYSCGHHDPPGVCGPKGQTDIMEGDGRLKGYFTRMLTASGELTGKADAGSWWPYRKSNVIYKLQKAEPKFRAKYGELPELRYGGPDYDKVGRKIVA